MLVLLFTIFFSGFVIPISRLVHGVRQAAFTVPATAGTATLQEVMFRGNRPSPGLIALLALYAILAMTIAGLILKRQRQA